MSVDVLTEIVIARSRPEVADYTAEGPFPMATTYTFEDVDAGTRMTLRNRGEPSGFSKLVAPVMASAIRRANEKDLARIKAILEGRRESG